MGFKKPQQRKAPRNFSGKDPKAVVCCYFLRDMCKNGDDCKFSHDRALAGGACSWGADCRYGHGKSFKTSARPARTTRRPPPCSASSPWTTTSTQPYLYIRASAAYGASTIATGGRFFHAPRLRRVVRAWSGREMTARIFATVSS